MKLIAIVACFTQGAWCASNTRSVLIESEIARSRLRLCRLWAIFCLVLDFSAIQEARMGGKHKCRHTQKWRKRTALAQLAIGTFFLSFVCFSPFPAFIFKANSCVCAKSDYIIIILNIQTCVCWIGFRIFGILHHWPTATIKKSDLVGEWFSASEGELGSFFFEVPGSVSGEFLLPDLLEKKRWQTKATIKTKAIETK